MFCCKSQSEFNNSNAICQKCKAGAVVRKCLEQLSEEQRLVVLAYYYDDMSTEEIAEIFETNEEVIKSRLSLTKKHLMIAFAEEAEKQGCKFCATEIRVLVQTLDDIMKLK